jgi:uncharacterized oxidoreductase
LDWARSTILITGGGSGIGRALAERFHRMGAKVIVADRRQGQLDEVTRSRPGMSSVVLDVSDAEAVQAFAKRIVRDFPSLNVLINNAGVMQFEQLTQDSIDLRVAESTVAINLLGPIRLTAALLPHLRAQSSAAVVNVSSGLAFVPLAASPTYCATKAAIHSYSLSLRQQLKGTSVRVIELVPPYVQTHLTGEQQARDPNAMPLDAFIDESLDLLAGTPVPDEIAVERVAFMRRAEAEGRFDAAFNALNAH